jgi:polyribonucleotide 5'-hydroxyl-kinase
LDGGRSQTKPVSQSTQISKYKMSKRLTMTTSPITETVRTWYWRRRQTTNTSPQSKRIRSRSNMSNNNNDSANNNDSLLPPPRKGVERHTLATEEELRLEVSFGSGSSSSRQKRSVCTLTLQQGSCELYGIELAIGKPYHVGFGGGGLKLALFTWHGCVVDVDAAEENLEISYTSDETVCNIAYVNTHAQLEALRDQAASASSANSNGQGQGPRVLICGGKDSGKTSLAKVLTAYACKLGRTPILVDLDPADNIVSVPGTIAACPMNLQALTVESYATTGLPPATASPLVLWHGTAQVPPLQQLDLFQQQVAALADKINRRLEYSTSSSSSNNNNTDNGGSEQQQQQQQRQNERTSGIIVNTNAYMIQDEGYQVLLHTIQAFNISVVLVMGHDRLYSMLNLSLKNSNSSSSTQSSQPKIIKLPRSGGVVSRNATFLRQCKSRSMKRYFYGDMMEQKQDANIASSSTSASASAANARSVDGGGATNCIPQLTPFLLQIPLDQVQIYQYTSISLSASLLPMGAAQATEAVQLALVNGPQEEDEMDNKQQQQHQDKKDNHSTSTTFSTASNIQQKLSHHLLAVCHPTAVAAYTASGRAADLYTSGVAGFVSVERIVHDKIHLLTPCAGSLPSNVLLLGDVTWME